MRLIDADTLIHELNNSHYPGAPYVDAGISIAIGKVCDAPTIEPERKTGKWLPTICKSDGMHHEWCGFHCSICKKATMLCHNFCPRCGAKMERR